MKNVKVTFRDNLGSVDARAVGLDHKECTEGATVNVTADQAAALKKLHPAIFVEADEKQEGAASKPATEEESPVSDEAARVAIDDISRMTSKDKLKAIADNDARATVKKAAQERLEALK